MDIYPKAQRAVRDVLRKRAHVAGAPYRFTLQCQADARVNQAKTQGLLPEADQVLAVTSSLALLDCLSQQITTLEKAVTTSLKHKPAYEQLLRVEGIGTI